MSLKRPIKWPIKRPLTRAIGEAGGGGGNPLQSLFAEGADGGWYGFPYEPGVGLFQERTGAAATTPALVGDPVGTVADKSGNGRYRTAASDAARPVLRQDANGYYYLEYDATDDSLRTAATYTLKMPQFILSAYAKGQESNVSLGATKNSSNFHRLLTFTSGRTGANIRGADATIAEVTAVTANNATPVGTLVLASSQAKASSVDLSINGGTKISSATTWTSEEITGAYIGSGALALNHEYGLIQSTTEPSDTLRQRVALFAGNLYGLSILPNVFDVVIIGGQSNAIARADASGDAHPANCYQYDGTAVKAATVPLDHVDDVAGDVGPDVTFADAWMASYGGRNLLFVPVAEGSTRFSNGGWRKGGTQYNRLVTRANAVLAAYPNATLRGIIMALGENDTLAGLGAATFETDMDQFIADVRADVTGASTVPIVWGGMAPTWIAESSAARTPYQAVIEAIGSRNAYTAYASSAGLSSISGDSVHLDRDAVRTIGQRYFDAFAVAEANTP